MSISHPAEELLSRVSITDVWLALGGRPPRHGRAPAFWRKTRDSNVALDDEKNCWFDHARDEGGGVLDLIIRARGGDRKQAAKWLKDYLGLPVDRTLSAADKRDYARRKSAAEREARELVAWRDDLLELLRDFRNDFFWAFHRARRYINKHSLDSPLGACAADICDFYEVKYSDFDQRIDALLAAPWPTLRDLRRQSRRSAAA